MLYQRTLITRYSVGFQNIGAAILADTITFTIRDLTGTTFQWLVKENITDLDAEALAGNFGNITSTSKDITFTLGSNFNVGDTYYFALREFDGITSQEVIQVSFTISQNAILGSGTSILVLPPEGVGSVNGETGDVVLTQDDVLNGTTNVQFSLVNKNKLDSITAIFTTALKTAYDSAVTWITTNGTNILNHISNTTNPHEVTKTQIGLSNVDNTSDINKPISTATQTALNNRVTLDTTQTITGLKGFNNNDTFFGTGQTNANLCFVSIGNLGTTNSVFFDTRSVNVPNVNIILRPRGTGVVSINNTRLIEVATPTANTDAANKAYVDNNFTTLGTTQTITANKSFAKLRTSGGNPATIASDVDIQIGDGGTTNAIGIGDSVKIRGNFGHSEETFQFSGRQKRWRKPDGTTTVFIDADSGRINHGEPTLAGDSATRNYVDNPFEWTPANYGYLSWNYDPAIINNTTALVNGTAVGIKLRVPRATTITNIIINLNAGGGLDNCFVALYQDNTLLAQSANQTDWNVGGNKVIPLSSPQAVTAGTVDVVVWCGTSTSAPLLQRSGSQPGTNGSFTGVNLRWFTANTGLTTTAPTTLGTRSSNSSTFWAAVS